MANRAHISGARLLAATLVTSLLPGLGAIAEPRGIVLPGRNIEASVTADFDGDRLADYAMLVTGKDTENGEKTSRFQIYLRLPNVNEARFRRIIDVEVGWSDRLHASLRLNPRGSIVQRTTYAASGAGDNETWTRTLTIQVRNGEAMVIGYAYSQGERLSGKVEFDCDVNLLTGSGLRNGSVIRVNAKPIAVRTILADGASASVPGCED